MRKPLADHSIALAILCVALAIRTLVAVLFTHPIGDTPGYADIARHISLGDGFLAGDPPVETLRRAPAYPALLAMSFLVGGQWSGLASVIIQVALDSVVGVLVFALLREVFDLDRGLSAVGGFFYAAVPFQSYIAAGLQSETLFTFLLAAGVSLVAVGLKRDVMAEIAAGGVLLGAAALTRPVALGFVVSLVAVLGVRWLRMRRWRSALVVVFLAFGAAAAVVPWTVRNLRASGELVPIQLGAGDVFYVATFSQWDQKNEGELWPRFHADPVFVEATSGRLPPNESESLMLRAGLENIKRDPGGYLHSRLANYPYLFVYGGDFATEHPIALGDLVRHGDVIGLIRKVGYALLFAILPLLLAFAAILDRRWRTWPTLVVAAFWIYNAATETVLWVEPRYYAPSVPFLAAWATAGLGAVARTRIGETVRALLRQGRRSPTTA